MRASGAYKTRKNIKFLLGEIDEAKGEKNVKLKKQNKGEGERVGLLWMKAIPTWKGVGAD